MITLKRENSGKRGVANTPFSTIFNKNTVNSLSLNVPVIGGKHSTDSKTRMMTKPLVGKENNLGVPDVSPRRLSHITEKSADERLTVKSKRTLRRSTSSCGAQSKHYRASIQAVADSDFAIFQQSSMPRSSSLYNDGTLERQTGSVINDALEMMLSVGDDLYSDVAQLGTPHPFDLQAEDMNLFCSQSAISVTDSVSDELFSSQLDFIYQFQTQYVKSSNHPESGPMTGPNPSVRRGSSTGAGTDPHITASGGMALPPFMLSPLNEYDEEFDNPLNKAMIVESSAAGFLWSKQKGEPTAECEGKQGDFKLRDDLNVMDHSF